MTRLHSRSRSILVDVLAAVAEYECERIAQRTKVVLGKAKARGTKLDNPRAAKAAVLARKAIVRFAPPKVRPLIHERRTSGASLREIALELNQLGVPTPGGCQWYACPINAILATAA